MFTFLCLFVEPGNAAFVKSVAIAMRGGFGGRKRNVLGFVFTGIKIGRITPRRNDAGRADDQIFQSGRTVAPVGRRQRGARFSVKPL